MAAGPNIVLITSDQHRGDCFGFEGRRVKTPHLDHLALTGTRFAACITPNLVCQPARASILTGLLPRSHGVRDNGIDLPPRTGEGGFAGCLAGGGYDTGFIGKAHFSTSHTFRPTGTPECRTSSADYGPDWTGPYMGFEHVELIVEGHNYWPPLVPPAGQHYERWYHGDGRGEEKNRLHATKLPPDVGAGHTWHSALPPAWHGTTWIGDRAIAYLRRAHDAPFCLWVSFADPHPPFDAPEPWSRLHDPADIDLPRHRVTDFHNRPWWHKASREGVPRTVEAFRKIRQNRIANQTDDQLRALIANYYGMISLIDHNVGRIVNALREEGLTDNTLIVFSADHGDWLGDHGLIAKGPMAYEGLLRVGLFFNGPGVPAGQRVDDPVSTMDLAPTCLDYAGIAPAGPMHGTSLRGLIEGHGDGRDFAFSEWDMGPARTGVALNLRTVRTRDHKLTVDEISGAGELYNLRDDPDEMTNLFDDPGAAAARAELMDMIASRPDDALADPLPVTGMA